MPLTPEEQETYAWQLDVAGFSPEAQQRLKASTVLVSRVGGLGGMVALQLAAAGIGRLILAHAGNLKPSDLNRQVLMSHDHLGTPRLDSAVQRLRAFNPYLDIVPIPENANPDNALRLARNADVIVDAAPLFIERYALNQAAVTLRKPMVEAAVFDMELHLTTFLPGQTGCLRCLYPEDNPTWTRKFPVLGAVAATAGALAALEVIKCLTGFAPTLAGTLAVFDLRQFAAKKLRIHPSPDCPVCANASSSH
jgi:molybdopterin/thiamine biosynthesis adenylyltransferase